jgi:hypothetical protein
MEKIKKIMKLGFALLDSRFMTNILIICFIIILCSNLSEIDHSLGWIYNSLSDISGQMN